MITNIMLYCFVWLGHKLFQYIDLCRDGESVRGMTFTNDEKYLEAVSKIELGEAK